MHAESTSTLLFFTSSLFLIILLAPRFFGTSLPIPQEMQFSGLHFKFCLIRVSCQEHPSLNWSLHIWFPLNNLFVSLLVGWDRRSEPHHWRPLPLEVCSLQLLLQRRGQEGEKTPSFHITSYVAGACVSFCVFSILKLHFSPVTSLFWCFTPLLTPFLSSGDRCGDGQGWQGPLRAVGHLGREDGVFPSDAEQPRGRERHRGQTEDCLSNPQSQRGVEEKPAPVSNVTARRTRCCKSQLSQASEALPSHFAPFMLAKRASAHNVVFKLWMSTEDSSDPAECDSLHRTFNLFSFTFECHRITQHSHLWHCNYFVYLCCHPCLAFVLMTKAFVCMFISFVLLIRNKCTTAF